MIWLSHHFYYFIGWLFIVGLVIGSFLNVVIHRLPIMLKEKWQQECQSFLKTIDKKKKTDFNLAWPSSHCPSCKTKIKPWHNIPLVSYFILRGRCAYCDAVISWQYPAVELLTAAISLIVAFHFGVTYACFAFLILIYALICLMFIDLNYNLLPDEITIPFLWVGLGVNLFGIFVPLSAAVIGAISAYLVLWLVNYIYRWIRKKDGMGYGDFKLFAMLGAWLGWQSLPIILLLAAVMGAIVGAILIIRKRIKSSHPIPFGPYLAIAGFVVGLWGQSLINGYFF